MSTQVMNPQPRSQPQLFTASAGMATVALVCASSGLVYGAGKLFYGPGTPPQSKHWLYVFFFWGLVIPYFFYREASLEEPQLPPLIRSNNTFVAFLCTLFVSLVISLALLSADITWRDGLRLGSALAIAVVPFWYLGIRSSRLVSRNGEGARNERSFKNKVLLPAFATCLISFSFGWSIVHPDWAIICLLVPAVVIIGMKEVLVAFPSLPSYIVVAFFLFSTSILFLLYRVGDLEFAKALTIGFLLTFAMGVAEVCKRVVLYRSNRRNYSMEDEDFYLAGSNWASIVFPLLLCFLPLLIDELPVYTIFFILALQYLHWHHLTKDRRHGFLLFLNTALGFLLPIFVSLQYIINIRPLAFGAEIFEGLVGYAGVTLALIIAVLVFASDKVQKFFRDSTEQGLQAYADQTNCFFLFLFVMILTILAVGFYGTIAYADLGLPVIKAKAAETIAYLLMMLILVIAVSFRNIFGSRQAAPPPSNQSQTSPPAQAVRSAVAPLFAATAFLLLLKVGRLPLGLIAGSAVVFILSLHTSLPWWLIGLHMLPVCLVTLSGFALNDIFDVYKDREALQDKPVAIGLVSLHAAGLLAFTAGVSALLIAGAIMRGPSLYIISAASIGVIAYSWLAQKMPTVKGVATAILCCTPFAYAAAVANFQFPPSFYAFLVMFISGRELLLDVKDITVDRIAGLRTLVTYLNPYWSRFVGWSLMFASISFVMLVSGGIGRILFAITFCILLLCYFIYLKNERRGLAWSRLALFSGVLATAFSL